MKTKFSKFLTGFRKNRNTQYAQLRMIENQKTQLKKRNNIDVIIMDLSKVSDTLNCNLLVAERNTCGLHLNTASFIKSYLRNRYQRCKIGDSFSEWERIISLDPHFLTFSYMTFFYILKTQTFVIMQMVVPFMNLYL